MSDAMRGAVRFWSGLLCLAILSGCAMVEIRSISASEYINHKRGDILTSGALSASADETLQMAGLEAKNCGSLAQACIDVLTNLSGIPDEKRLATLAELWLLQAMNLPTPVKGVENPKVNAWLQTARYAYGYLFYTQRSPSQRAFEDRQTQVLDYYNYAVQEATTALFHAYATDDPEPLKQTDEMTYGGWRIVTDLSGIRLPGGQVRPKELIPASSLSFSGVRSVYRRDGFGAELVAVVDDGPLTSGDDTNEPFSEMPSPTLTVVFKFHAETLDELLKTRTVYLDVYDPYRKQSILLRSLRVPLAANFTAGYGLWLARSGFATQSLRTLLGREDGFERPHIYMMQPYDPDRRIIVMLHGLGSSPEAWVNLANEIMGDETLRRNYQIWQVYYPTNLPLAYNQAYIRRAILETLHHFDPDGMARASQDMVLIGHSMGGVLARLLSSSSGEGLWEGWAQDNAMDPEQQAQLEARAAQLFRFDPMPGVERVIFLASPHRGTSMARNTLVRWLSGLIRLPLNMLESVGGAFKGKSGGNADAGKADALEGKRPLKVPTSIDNLDVGDPFVLRTADLPIGEGIRYHSVIGQKDMSVPLEASDDGVVPYWSAYLEGAESQKVIQSGHSVQETPEAILEIRRILHEDVENEVQRRARSFPAQDPAAAPALPPVPPRATTPVPADVATPSPAVDARP